MSVNESDEWTFDQAVEDTRDARERLNRAKETNHEARETLNNTEDAIRHIVGAMDDLDEDLDEAFEQIESTDGDVAKAYEYLESVEAALEDLKEPTDPPVATITLSIGGSTWTMEMTPNYALSEEEFADTLVSHVGMQIDDLEAGNVAEVDGWSATGAFSSPLDQSSFMRPLDRQTE